MCSLAGVFLGILRRAPVVYWVMDLNPDEAIALGRVRSDSPLVRVFNLLNQVALAKAHSVVALDRFMAARVLAKRHIPHKLSVFPPWPQEDHLGDVPHEDNPFRRANGLDGKFVVMYSGNHTRVNPISTVIRAAARLEHRSDIAFVFVGGGEAKKEVEEAIAGGAKNILSLPYQPLSYLKYSLSAADMHVVTLGEKCVGIVHPCKIYGAMAIGRPVLAVAPRPSHVADLLDGCDFGRQVNHDDVDGAVRAILETAAVSPEERAAMGGRGRRLVQSRFSKRLLCGQFMDILDTAIRRLPRIVPLEGEPQHGDACASIGNVAPADRRKAA
jgi:glycosyltransferase involved in cell wall biosynthesis